MRGIARGTALCVVGLATGCATVAPVAGTTPAWSGPSAGEVSYSAGKATQDFAFPMSTVLPAAAAALTDLKIVPVRRSSDAGNLMIEAKTADDRRVLVTLRPRVARCG